MDEGVVIKSVLFENNQDGTINMIFTVIEDGEEHVLNTVLTMSIEEVIGLGDVEGLEDTMAEVASKIVIIPDDAEEA